MSAQRITRGDLSIMLARYVRACDALGLIAEGDRVHLETGSKAYGRAYRVATIPRGETGHYRPPAGGDYLGMTAREAFDTLADRAAVLEDVAYRAKVTR